MVNLQPKLKVYFYEIIGYPLPITSKVKTIEKNENNIKYNQFF